MIKMPNPTKPKLPRTAVVLAYLFPADLATILLTHGTAQAVAGAVAIALGIAYFVVTWRAVRRSS